MKKPNDKQECGLRALMGAALILNAMSFVSSGSAQTQVQIDQCENKGNAYSPDRAVEGCTAAIESGRWSGKLLAAAFVNRGNGL